MGSITKPILLAVVGILAVVLFLQTSNLITGMASENMTAITTLGGTNVEPTVFSVNMRMTAPINPCANDTDVIVCNASVYDPNGGSNISTVNGTLWSEATTQTGCDTPSEANRSFCYMSLPCTNVSVPGNVTLETYTCTFGQMAWYADNGTWNCTIWATDSIETSWNTSDTNIYPYDRAKLYALDINSSINWGSVAVGNTSQVNNSVRNCGNRLQDTRVNASTMDCTDPASVDILAGNISVGLTNAVTDIPAMNATLQKLDTNHVIPLDGNETINVTTYWNISVPAGVTGTCSGTAVFNAIESY